MYACEYFGTCSLLETFLCDSFTVYFFLGCKRTEPLTHTATDTFTHTQTPTHTHRYTQLLFYLNVAYALIVSLIYIISLPVSDELEFNSKLTRKI